MQEYAKDIPAELRRAVHANSSAHRDGGASSHVPLAGPSSESFRTRSAPVDSHEIARGQTEFNDFLRYTGSRSSVQAAGQPVPATKTASKWRPSWTEDVLQPRAEDSSGVLALLSQSDEFDTEQAILGQVTQDRELPWRDRVESKAPDDPSPAVRNLEGSEYRQADYPYLFNLVDLPEDESIAAYLSETSYTDDVWGLPVDIKRDLDAIRTPGIHDDIKRKALRRLGMLKGHLSARTDTQRSRTSMPRVMQDEDWNWIWKQHVS